MLIKFHLHKTPLRGFTLIELVVAMAVIAILAAVAIPSYSEYLVRSRREAIKEAMLEVAASQERFFAQKGVYAGTVAALSSYGITSDKIRTTKVRTGLVLNNLAGNSFWVSGFGDIDSKADTSEECWIYYGRNVVAVPNADRFVQLYDDVKNANAFDPLYSQLNRNTLCR